VEPRDEKLPTTIIELKIVNLMSLFPGEEDFDTKIKKGEDMLRNMSDEDILKLEVDIFKRRTTVEGILHDGLKQVGEYHKLVSEKSPRKGGYKSWVCVRVGLTRFVLRKLN